MRTLACLLVVLCLLNSRTFASSHGLRSLTSAFLEETSRCRAAALVHKRVQLMHRRHLGSALASHRAILLNSWHGGSSKRPGSCESCIGLRYMTYETAR